MRSKGSEGWVTAAPIPACSTTRLSTANEYHAGLRQLQFARVRGEACLMRRVLSVCFNVSDGLGMMASVCTDVCLCVCSHVARAAYPIPSPQPSFLISARPILTLIPAPDPWPLIPDHPRHMRAWPAR